MSTSRASSLTGKKSFLFFFILIFLVDTVGKNGVLMGPGFGLRLVLRTARGPEMELWLFVGGFFFEFYGRYQVFETVFPN